MKQMLGAIFVCVAVIAVLGGCARKVLEFDARLGVEIDKKTSFYAYSTPLKANDPHKVTVLLAGKPIIEDKEQVLSPDPEYVYPAQAYDPPRDYVRPRQLAEILEYAVVDTVLTENHFVLGYFMKRISSISDSGMYLEQKTESASRGLCWATAKERIAMDIREAVHGFRKFAAGYGADAVVEVAVFFTMDALYGGPGLFATGKAIAYDLSPEEAE